MEGYSGASDSARYFEVGMNEATYSLAWLPNQPHCLLAGMGSKFLRLYDIRGKAIVTLIVQFHQHTLYLTLKENFYLVDKLIMPW